MFIIGTSILIALLALTSLAFSISRNLGTRPGRQIYSNKKSRLIAKSGFLILVGLLGLEPRLFWTKTRRVASYTIGQSLIEVANLLQSSIFANFSRRKTQNKTSFIFKKSFGLIMSHYRTKILLQFLNVYLKTFKSYIIIAKFATLIQQ